MPGCDISWYRHTDGRFGRAIFSTTSDRRLRSSLRSHWTCRAQWVCHSFFGTKRNRFHPAFGRETYQVNFILCNKSSDNLFCFLLLCFPQNRPKWLQNLFEGHRSGWHSRFGNAGRKGIRIATQIRITNYRWKGIEWQSMQRWVESSNILNLPQTEFPFPENQSD